MASHANHLLHRTSDLTRLRIIAEHLVPCYRSLFLLRVSLWKVLVMVRYTLLSKPTCLFVCIVGWCPCHLQSSRLVSPKYIYLPSPLCHVGEGTGLVLTRSGCLFLSLPVVVVLASPQGWSGLSSHWAHFKASQDHKFISLFPREHSFVDISWYIPPCWT